MTVSDYNKTVDLYADNVFRYLLKSLKNKADAEDLIQITFEKLWNKRTDVPFKKAKSYMFSIAHNSMIDWIRKGKRVAYFDIVPDKGGSVSNEYDGLNEVIADGLEKLPEVQRSLIMLRDYEGYSYHEIGEISGLNESQVKVYIFRARKALQHYFIKLENVL
jgi:RNA polymerase sigma factor (sigma-70 family)